MKMNTKLSPIGTFLHQMLGIALIVLAVVVIFALFYHEVLNWKNSWVSLLVWVFRYSIWR